MKKRSLGVFVMGVIIALAVVNVIIFYMHGEAGLTFMEVFSFGYLVGMTAMYIAVHRYRWK
jgi:hypothetical protein